MTFQDMRVIGLPKIRNERQVDPILGTARKNVTLMFSGDTREHDAAYSHGTRQAVYGLLKDVPGW